MVWARLDDAILDNEKIVAAGVLGFALHIAAITWCCRNLTDGFIPRRKAACLLDMAALPAEILEATGNHPKAYEDQFLDAAGELGDPTADPIFARLVRSGLWVKDDEKDGFWLKDFLEYNPSREKVLAERSRGSDRKKESRSRLASASPETPSSTRTGLASDSRGPVPVPVPDPQRGEEIPPTPRDSSDGNSEWGLEPTGERDAKPDNIEPITTEQGYQAAYELGIEKATGRPFALPEKQRGELHQAMQKHAKDSARKAYRGVKLLEWITWNASEFATWVSAQPAEEHRFWSGFGPRGMLRWLNETPVNRDDRPSGYQRMSGAERQVAALFVPKAVPR